MVVNSDLIRNYGFKSIVKDERTFCVFLFWAFTFFGLEASRSLAWRRGVLKREAWITLLTFAVIILFLRSNPRINKVLIIIIKYFALNKHILNTVTCFFSNYIQSAVLPVMVFFILLVR